MTVLDRKLRRELLRSKGLLGSIVAILAIGVACLVGMLATWQNLEVSRLDFYARCRMADFWVDLKKAPVQDLADLDGIEGIASIRDRITFPVNVEDLGGDRPVRGVLVTLPDDPHPVLSGALIQDGSYFTGRTRNEVIVSTKFADAHRLRPGDALALVLHGRRERFRIVGTALSSEFVYMTPPGDLAPDAAGYGLFLIPRSRAEEIFDFEGATNSLVGTFTPEGRANPEAVLAEVSRRLARFGVFGAYPRSDQGSHLALTSEMDGLKSMATFLPVVFFGVATLILNVLMLRTVQRERTLIGTLLALGVSRAELRRHYLRFGLTVGLAGAIAGCALGQWIAASLTNLYRTFFEFPELVVRVYPLLMLVATGVAVSFAALGARRGMRNVLRLRPADAMRPAPPEGSGKIVLERVTVLWARLSSGGRMVARNLFRHRARTATGVLAATLGAAIVVVALGFIDVMGEMLTFQFERVLVSDYTIGLRDEKNRDAVTEVARLPGVTRAEPLLDAPVTFENGTLRKRGAIQGVTTDARLTVPHDADGNPVAIPTSGLLMTARLAEQLDVVEGSAVAFRFVRGEQNRVEALVARIVESRFGLAVYADYDWLNRLLGEVDAVSQIQVEANHDAATRDAFYEETRRRPEIGSVAATGAMKQRTEEEFLGMMYGFAFVLVGFAGAIFFGSVLNSSLISMAERVREVATLCAIGWKNREVSRIFLAESLAMNLAGVVPGLLLGRLLMVGMARSFQNDMFSLPSRIAAPSYVYTVLLSVLFVFLAHAVVARRIRRLSWTQELGSKE